MRKQDGKSMKKQRVTFTCTASQARDVFLVGDFNQWRQDTHPMKMKKKGHWTKVIWLLPGTYEYKFWVDGEWRTDAESADKCRNCYGTRNSLITIEAK